MYLLATLLKSRMMTSVCLRWSRFCDSSCTKVVYCVSVECWALKPFCQRYNIECLSKCAMMLLTIMCSWIVQHHFMQVGKIGL